MKLVILTIRSAQPAEQNGSVEFKDFDFGDKLQNLFIESNETGDFEDVEADFGLENLFIELPEADQQQVTIGASDDDEAIDSANTFAMAVMVLLFCFSIQARKRASACIRKMHRIWYNRKFVR